MSYPTRYCQFISVLVLVALLSPFCFSTLISLEPTKVGTLVPYGVYVIRNQWGCSTNHPRCHADIGLKVGYENESMSRVEVILTPEVEVGVSFEISPNSNGLYEIKLKQGCNEDPPRDICNKTLSHTNGSVELNTDYITLWNIDFDPKSGFWKIFVNDSELGEDHILSFTQNYTTDGEMVVLETDDGAVWDLLLDTNFIESQKLDGVQFDLGAVQYHTNIMLTLHTEKVVNLGNEYREETVSIEYYAPETEKFEIWKGFVPPIETTVELRSPVYDGFRKQFTFTEYIKTYHTVLGLNSFHQYQMFTSREVKIPPGFYENIKVSAFQNTFSMPYNAFLTQVFTTGKTSTQLIRGRYYNTQVFGMNAYDVDVMPLEDENYPPMDNKTTWLSNTVESHSYDLDQYVNVDDVIGNVTSSDEHSGDMNFVTSGGFTDQEVTVHDVIDLDEEDHFVNATDTPYDIE